MDICEQYDRYSHLLFNNSYNLRNKGLLIIHHHWDCVCVFACITLNHRQVMASQPSGLSQPFCRIHCLGWKDAIASFSGN